MRSWLDVLAEKALAAGVIRPEEREWLREADEARDEAILVDAFEAGGFERRRRWPFGRRGGLEQDAREHDQTRDGCQHGRGEDADFRRRGEGAGRASRSASMGAAGCFAASSIDIAFR